MAGTHRRPHAIMIPYPYQGHINPFVYLAMKLASHGFTITFLNTQSVHYRISRAQLRANGTDIFTKARESGLDIRYATVSDGFPLSFDRSLNHDQFVEGLLHVFSAHVDELVADLCKSDPHLQNRKDMIDYIPGVEAIKPTDLMSYLQAADTGTVVHRVIYRAFEDIKKADIIICNTVQELESQTLSALRKKQPTYAIGPIVSSFTSQSVSTSLWCESDCTQWLNSKPDGSVLYVSFGSHAHTTSRQDIWEIANGLLASGVNFLWVVRPDIVSPDESDFLPTGFVNAMKGKGLIIQWCSQIKVISHRAIGGFLSHCGWNSVLESIWCGIPLICFPLFTDQFTNRKLVVNDWRIGINLCDRETITREEVAEKIRYLMSRKSSEELRSAVMNVRRTLKKALPSDGSSERNFSLFIEEIKVQMKKECGASVEIPDQSANHVWVPNGVNLCQQAI
ncbi:hypothetical protein F511_13932 [Dorcoceras hygrometricum]|uniref:Glycosyltransferase n=1 Tax=Dorcoceras hygrometricum TaxID=472368 RepID=A0A2Z7AW12_9LAMI|nr:hypothetical protein F511_13932 [Dorcoceras hygrometricum]